MHLREEIVLYKTITKKSDRELLGEKLLGLQYLIKRWTKVGLALERTTV